MTWMVAEKESEESWGDLLYAVKQMRLRSPGCWDLLISGDTDGFEAARKIYCSDGSLWRFNFHELRNILRD